MARDDSARYAYEYAQAKAQLDAVSAEATVLQEDAKILNGLEGDPDALIEETNRLKDVVNSLIEVDRDTITTLTIPEGVTSLRAYFMKDALGLTTVHIPEGVTTIGLSAFSGCKALSTVYLPSTITSIGANAFASHKSGIWIYIDKTKAEIQGMANYPFGLVAKASFSCSDGFISFT